MSYGEKVVNWQLLAFVVFLNANLLTEFSILTESLPGLRHIYTYWKKLQGFKNYLIFFNTSLYMLESLSTVASLWLVHWGSLIVETEICKFCICKTSGEHMWCQTSEIYHLDLEILAQIKVYWERKHFRFSGKKTARDNFYLTSLYCTSVNS